MSQNERERDRERERERETERERERQRQRERKRERRERERKREEREKGDEILPKKVLRQRMVLVSHNFTVQSSEPVKKRNSSSVLREKPVASQR